MTSIEWLEMEIVKLESKFPIPHAVYELCEQAKEKHKAENIDFAKHCLDRALDLDIRTAYSNVEKYYNETFKKD